MDNNVNPQYQNAWSELAHGYAHFLETGDPKLWDQALPQAQEWGIEPKSVVLSVRQTRDDAALARIIQEQYEEAPELLEGVRPGLLERFLRRKES